MVLAPVAVFALIAPVVAKRGPGVLSLPPGGWPSWSTGACLVRLLVGSRREPWAPWQAQPQRFFREAPARRGLRLFSSASSAGAPSLLAGGRRAPGRPAGVRSFVLPPGCHPQHGRHRHLPGV